MGRSYTSRNSNSKAVHIHHEVTMAIYIVAIKRRGNKKNSELTTFI